MSQSRKINRRTFLLSFLLVPFSKALGKNHSVTQAFEPTPEGFEGPFYPITAMRFQDDDSDLVKIKSRVESAGGEVVRIIGKVLDQTGKPVNNAVVEIWQCDLNGRYLHTRDVGGKERDPGFQGFGRSQTSETGEYAFRTIRPVPYPGRTPHIHVKVLHQDKEILVTQLYVSDHPLNQYDGLFQRISPAQRSQVSLTFNTEKEPVAVMNLIV